MAGTGVLSASPPTEATPWTKSFLETRTSAFIDHHSMALRGNRYAKMSQHQLEGTLLATSAPLQDWEFDLGIQGRTLSTTKFFVRAERQLFSDLANDPLAITVVVDASTSGHQRSSNPVFFEMAKNVAECGIGCGRHLLIQKNGYTQLFAYLLGGVGSSRALYVNAEVGVKQVFFQRHFFRLSVSHIKTYGSENKRFRGIATLKTDVNTIACSYVYRWYSGIEGRVTFIRRLFTSGGIRTSTTCQAGISIPIAL